MNNIVMSAVMLAEFMDLCMTVMASGDTVSGSGGLNLLVLQSAVLQPLVLEPGLQETAPAAAAIIVGAVGLHVDEVFLADHGFDYKPEILGDRIPKSFTNNLTGILNRELDLQILVPVGIDLQFAFPDPFGIVFVDVFDFKIVFQVEFFQSGPD